MEKDIRTPKSSRGAYEWWYFDAVSDDGKTELVIIFYEGNPFSRRYIQHQQNRNSAQAEKFPAISISIYRNNNPVYYSFTEIAKENASFGEDKPAIRIEDHRMSVEIKDSQLIYLVDLSERLPSGDTIEGQLKFIGDPFEGDLGDTSSGKIGHRWHLIQPRARVEGQIDYGSGNDIKTIHFEGEGYHDHNVGSEPLKNKFEHWYWGRFHFKNLTLIYYLMGDKQPINEGWLLDKKAQNVLEYFEITDVTDYSRTLFGLNTGRKIALKNDRTQVMIQQSTLLDNGPFYQRFSSDAFLTIPGRGIMESSYGITEYLNPSRIYNRLYWPLTNMRIWYKSEGPHWVQRSRRLYRWTW